MSRYNKNGPLTPKQLARIKRAVAGAHALGGSAYADCRALLGFGVAPELHSATPKKVEVRRPDTAAKVIEVRRKERAMWWQARGVWDV